jgi:hypothetical protein
MEEVIPNVGKNSNIRNQRSEMADLLSMNHYNSTQDKHHQSKVLYKAVKPNYLLLNECCLSFKGLHMIFGEILKKRDFIHSLYELLQSLFIKELSFLEEKFYLTKKTWDDKDYVNIILKNLFVYKENLSLIFPTILNDFFTNFSKFLKNNHFKSNNKNLIFQYSNRSIGNPIQNINLIENKNDKVKFANKIGHYHFNTNLNELNTLENNQNTFKDGKINLNISSSDKCIIMNSNVIENRFDDQKINFEILQNPKQKNKTTDSKNINEFDICKIKSDFKIDIKRGKQTKSPKILKTYLKKSSVKSSIITKNSNKIKSKKKSRKKKKKLNKTKIKKKLKNYFEKKFKVNNKKKISEEKIINSLDENFNMENRRSNVIQTPDAEVSAINFDLMKLNNDFNDISGSRKSLFIAAYADDLKNKNKVKDQRKFKKNPKSKKEVTIQTKSKKMNNQLYSNMIPLKYNNCFFSLSKSLSKETKNIRFKKKENKTFSKKSKLNFYQIKNDLKKNLGSKKKRSKLSINKIINNEKKVINQKNDKNSYRNKLKNKYNPFSNRKSMSNSLNTKYFFEKKMNFHRYKKSKPLMSKDFIKTKKN